MNADSSKSRYVSALVNEPLFHFTVIAALLFLSFSSFQTDEKNLLEINQREIDARIYLSEMSSGTELNAQQVAEITQAYIEEQVLVSEAKARGLDNDTRIHTILNQKLRHVLSGDVIQPEANELRSFYQENSSRYRSLATVTVDELVFDTREELQPAVIQALSSGRSSEDILRLESGSAAPLPRVSLVDLSNIFDDQYAESVFAAATGDWIGPYISNRGQHWLQISQHNPERVPALDEIIDLVRLDWIAIEEDLRLQTEVNALLDQYTIVIHDDSE